MKRTYLFGGAALVAAVTMATGLSVTACGKKKSGGGGIAASTDLTVSGTLSLTSSASLNLTGTSANGVSANDLSVYCVTFSVPPTAGTGEVDSNGTFTLSVPNGKGASIGCFILKGEEQLGTIVFKDTTEKSLDGTDSENQRAAFSDNASFGTISFDVDTGKAAVDLATVTTTQKTSAADAAGFDFSGSYEFADAGVTPPTGYSAIPTTRQDGPSVGFPIYIKRIEGQDSTTGAAVYGIMVWESQEKFSTACGGKLGMSYADAETHGKVNLRNSGIPEGSFTFSWTTNGADGWKNPNATTSRQMPSMQKTTVDGYTGNAQFVTSGFNYGSGTCASATDCFMFNAETAEAGCRNTTTGKPVMVSDWSGISNCTNTAVGTTNLLNKSDCTGTYNSEPVRCVHIGGFFKGGINAPTKPTVTTWPQWPTNFQVTAANTLCSSMTSDTMGQLRCYAEALRDAERNPANANLCIRRVNFNWGAQSASDFILPDNGPAKAFGEYVFEKFRYDSPTSGTFGQEEVRYEGINTGNGWTDCRMIERMQMSLRKIDDAGNLLGEMIIEERNADAKPACAAAFANGNSGKSVSVQKMIFKLNKK